MNLFLTGEKRVGKSTIIKKVLADFPGKVCGFYTLPLMGMKGFVLEDILTGESLAISKDSPVDLTEVFEDLGVKILSRCLANRPDLLIMDELGRFEKEAYGFKRKVLDCLDSDVAVLGVVQKETEWLEVFGRRADTVILRVDETNREEVYLQVKEIMDEVPG